MDQRSHRPVERPQRRLPLFDEQSATFFITTIHGLEEELVAEINELAADCGIQLSSEPTVASAGVYVRGPWTLCLAMNFGLRCASRILCEIYQGEVRTIEDVYASVEKMNWPAFFKLDKTFMVNATSTDPNIKAPSLNLKIKDGIVDSFKRQTRERPSVEKDAPQVRVMARLHRGLLSVSVDTTGIPLSARGYRTATHDAPLSELLAAGLVRMTGWNRLCRELRRDNPEKVYFSRVEEKSSQREKKIASEAGEEKVNRRIPGAILLSPDFIDPMCGTGTFAIEAALALLNRRPQLERKHFAYEWLEILPASAMKQIEYIRRTIRAQELSLLDVFRKISLYKQHALGRVVDPDSVKAPLLCRDKDLTAIAAAKKNAEAAGVSKLIHFEKRDIMQMHVDEPEGIIVMNPPYGVRLGEEEELKAFYKDIGDTLKKNCRGWQAWILVGSEAHAGSVGLRATRRKKAFNGGIECLWLQYVLF
jgi:putative N6-adenine-specific DNA methylase